MHPGWLHDLERPGHLVLSLLAEPEVFTEGVERLVRPLASGGGDAVFGPRGKGGITGPG